MVAFSLAKSFCGAGRVLLGRGAMTSACAQARRTDAQKRRPFAYQFRGVTGALAKSTGFTLEFTAMNDSPGRHHVPWWIAAIGRRVAPQQIDGYKGKY
jgi:hypothetical protein